MLKRTNKTLGFTLVELLISLLLGSLLLVMLIGLYVNSVSASAKALQFSRLRTELQGMLALMESDIRRAGYGGSEYRVGKDRNKVFDILNTETQKCIIYAYNYKLAESISSSYFMGFRYSTATKNLQFGSKVDTQAINCFSSGSWVKLNDPDFLKITSLSFIESTAVIGQTTKRSVDIAIAGELTTNSDYKYKAKIRVQARNSELN
ncbi:prepilin-type N-terminal cleavage/methylation domain-containing protein [Psychromonas algicola]|uniref:prepilin-type N-terminal cleavage/methylation domain-containing protein n=1 Tax=Psychromonas algicola TaxID=2555642 RepID=UPI00106787F1|nr:prepilin-type N-terminal cleavage/methylation domain-containing protein [Psychromonas sp. RZ5]TEW50649.1 pilus assembly protein PilW [Psychromonas sp. RZ5]